MNTNGAIFGGLLGALAGGIVGNLALKKDGLMLGALTGVIGGSLIGANVGVASAALPPSIIPPGGMTPMTLDAHINLVPGPLGSFAVSANGGAFDIKVVPNGPTGTAHLAAISAPSPVLLGRSDSLAQLELGNSHTGLTYWGWTNVGAAVANAAGTRGTITVLWYDDSGNPQTSTIDLSLV
jgi:hypothetical protein